MTKMPLTRQVICESYWELSVVVKEQMNNEHVWARFVQKFWQDRINNHQHFLTKRCLMAKRLTWFNSCAEFYKTPKRSYTINDYMKYLDISALNELLLGCAAMAKCDIKWKILRLSMISHGKPHATSAKILFFYLMEEI